MDGTILLIIGLASLALVLIAFAYCGLKAWRVYRNGMGVYDHLAPIADHLNGWGTVVEAKAQKLADNGEAISVNLEHLKTSITRLQIVAEALNESVMPLHRALRYLR